MTSEDLPIGVFDSGIGGLTVLRELSLSLPTESFVYLGDVARLPYGTKSKQVVENYVERCVDFLAGQKVKMIVIACNTATAMALGKTREHQTVPVFGVIEPGVRAALKHKRNGKFLVLATGSTVKSEAYLKEFALQDTSVKVDQIACPLLVPLAEEGWFASSVTETVIAHYLQGIEVESYDAIVLGCTHYPLLEPSFRKVLGDAIALVHSGEALAQQVSTLLTEQKKNPRSLRFYSTDPIDGSLPILTRLFDGPIEFERVDL